MSFQHPLLSNALDHQFGNNPNRGKGLSTAGGFLTDFHPDLGPFPTDAQQQAWVTIYEALPADHPSKDAQANRRTRLQALNIDLELKKVLMEIV